MTTWQGVGFALLAATLCAGALALLGLPLIKGRGYYMAGLVGAFLAFVLGTLVNVIEFQLPLWAMSALSPAIEEPIRVVAAFAFLAQTKDRGCWLAFALGYALLESSVKLGDAVVMLGPGGDPVYAAALLSAPLAPLTLHVFLGVLTMRLSAWNAPTLLAILATFLLHTAHNFSTFALSRPDDWAFLLVEIWARSLFFVLFTALVIRKW